MKNSILIGLLSFTWISCNFFSNSPRERMNFYNSPKEQDLYRIPLLDPVDLASTDEWNWFLRLGQLNTDVDAPTIFLDSIAFQDSILYGYNRSVYFKQKMTKLWYIVNCHTGSIEYYSTYEKFNKKTTQVNFQATNDYYQMYWEAMQ